MNIHTFQLNKSFWVFSVCTFILLSANILFAQQIKNKDRVMVISTSGNVKLTTDKMQVTPLIRIRQGEIVDLEKYAKLEIIYFNSGNKEDWRGPAKFEIGNTESKMIEGKPFATHKTKGIGIKLAQSMEIASFSRQGMVRVRGANKLELRRIEQKYMAEKERFPDSILPEIYLLSAWDGFCEDKLIKEKLDEIGKEFAGRDDANILISLYSNRVRSAEAQATCDKIAQSN